jgi:hypothetical protein
VYYKIKVSLTFIYFIKSNSLHVYSKKSLYLWTLKRICLEIHTNIKLNETEKIIFRNISEIFYSSVCGNSILKRSISLTLQELIFQFPDYLQNDVKNTIKKMTSSNLLMIKYDGKNSIEYCINPNKFVESLAILKEHDLLLDGSIEPLEERLRGYKKIFSNEGKNLTQGKKSKYDYYQKIDHDENYELDFYVVIIGKNENIRITKIGSIKDPSSLGGSILSIITKMPSTFSKVDIENRISRNILKNRQPLRAVLDILIYLKIIETTGKKINRSEEFRKINTSLSLSTLDDF